MAPVSALSAATRKHARVQGVDVARGLASMLMVQGHAFDAWASAEARGTTWYAIESAFLQTLALPAFLVLAGASLALRVEAAIAPPVAAFGGFQAGLLSGGALRRFFDEVLPTATLSVKPIADALGQARAFPREGLKPALDLATAELLRELERDVGATGEAARRDWERLRARTYEPLRALHEVLEELVQ